MHGSTTGSGADARTRTVRVPFYHSVTIPFNIGETVAEALLTAFFNLTGITMPTGTTLTTPVSDVESLGAIRAAIGAIVNLVERPDEDTIPEMVDEDVTTNE